MIYLANPSTEPIRDAMRAGHLGFIATPTTTGPDVLPVRLVELRVRETSNNSATYRGTVA